MRYNPDVSITDSNFAWQAKSFSSEIEEKLQFDRLALNSVKLSPLESAPKIRVKGTEEVEKGVESMAQHLIAATSRKTLPIALFGFGPFGLSNDLYFGHTFWDMDVWVVPTLLFLNPNAVKDMACYRIDRAMQAQKNFEQWCIETGRDADPKGMMFPWESSVSGKEVCMGKTKHQHHISGDVLWGLTQAETFGLVDSKKVRQIEEGVGAFYKARSVKTKRGLEILDVTSPNERFEGDNDLYTNALAEWVTNHRSWKAKPTYYLPRDEKSFLNYDGDLLRDYQQAAGLLSIYPLQFPAAEREAKIMMDRFADKISPNGPAMGRAVTATIYARIGEPQMAYQTWLECWKPNMYGPNRLFSERRTPPRLYFYTGAAGALNTLIYGFAGFRIDHAPAEGAKWKRQLKSGWWLSVKPSMPKEIKEISLDEILIDGKSLSFKITNSGEVSVIGA